MELASVRLPLRVIADSAGWTLSSWLVSPGSTVHRNQRVASLQSPSTGAVDHALAPHSGKLARTFVAEGAVVSAQLPTLSDVTIAEIEYCPHSVVFSGLCAVCGEEASVSHFADVSNGSSNRLPVAYVSRTLSVTRAEAASIASVTARQLLQSRRLSLVLDLDHTLLHATDDPRAAAVLDHSPEGVDRSSIHSFALPPGELTSPQLISNKMHVKLRPGLGEFLTRCAERFELHIYTMGSRRYADQIAQIIDPDKRLFRGRVTSREDFDEGRSNQKNISRLFPCDDSMVLIIDDREDVWVSGTGALFMPNLIRAKPYTFWNGLHEAYDRALATNYSANDDLTGKGGPAESNQRLLIGPRTTVLVRPPTPENSATEEVMSPNKDGDDRPDTQHDGLSPVRATNRVVAEEPMPSLSEELRRLVREWWDNDCSVELGSNHLLQLAEVLESCHEKFFEKFPQSAETLNDSADVHETKERLNDGTSPIRTIGAKAIHEPKTLKIPADVKYILADIRARVLKGCVLTFTGLIPLGTRQEDSAVWQLAVRHGAECTRDFVLGWTTHVVVASSGSAITEKSRQALETGAAFCVHVKWLEDCTMQFEVRPELLYSVAHRGGDLNWVEYRKSVYSAYWESRERANLETSRIPNSVLEEKNVATETNVNRGKRPRVVSPVGNVAVGRVKLSHAANEAVSDLDTSRERVLGDDELDDALDAALEYASDA